MNRITSRAADDWPSSWQANRRPAASASFSSLVSVIVPGRMPSVPCHAQNSRTKAGAQ